ncbi:MAG: TIGR03986 family CRISPR-associated RAMP protein, partial [Campylobacterales bacterium]|nr:TIGR03986 family CRISPR-associated RAMP protein [Campylobacterales bacterium]
DGTFQNVNSPFKKAYEKYNLIDEDIFRNTYNFSSHKTDKSGRKIVTFEENGPNQGKLVLTGHPSARREPVNGKASGKIFDFVFMQKENSNDLDVSKEVFDNFKFAYFDGRKTQPKESEDWGFWKERLNDGGRVPVFFHKNFGGVSSFGLSYLYKFPYEKSIMQALIGNHGSDEIDLAESIFGFSKKIDDKQISLKGRVQFSHAKKICNTKPLDSRYVLLGTPKASYYPIYLVQNGTEYKTLMDNNSVLAGWKRYPVHQNFNHRCQGKSTQTTKIIPLNANSQFKLKIRFHNLKKVEIGALISAITFHNNDQYYHSLGMAKSYGYGKVQLKIDKFEHLKFTQDEYLKAFESAVNSEVFDNQLQWHQSEQIKNLFSMAIPQNDKNLEYMELKDFANNKNKNDDGSYNYLDRYINLDGVVSKNPDSLSDSNDIELYQDKIKDIREKSIKNKEEKKLLKAQKEEEKKAKQKEKDDWQKAILSNSIQALEHFISSYPDSIHIEEAKNLISILKQKEQEEKEKKAKEEVKKAFDSLDKKNPKHIESFIKKWQNTDYAQEFITQLQVNNEKSSNRSSLEELNTVDNTSRFKKILEENEDRLQENQELIKLNAIRVYNSLKAKPKKNFFKDIQLQRFLGKDFEDEVKSGI